MAKHGKKVKNNLWNGQKKFRWAMYEFSMFSKWGSSPPWAYFRPAGFDWEEIETKQYISQKSKFIYRYSEINGIDLVICSRLVCCLPMTILTLPPSNNLYFFQTFFRTFFRTFFLNFFRTSAIMQYSAIESFKPFCQTFFRTFCELFFWSFFRTTFFPSPRLPSNNL
jgi:hypothetical protein